MNAWPDGGVKTCILQISCSIAEWHGHQNLLIFNNWGLVACKRVNLVTRNIHVLVRVNYASALASFEE